MFVLVLMIVQRDAQKYVLNKNSVQPTANVLPRIFVLQNVLVLLSKYLKNALSIVRLIALISVLVRMIAYRDAQKYVLNKTCVQPTVNVLPRIFVLHNVLVLLKKYLKNALSIVKLIVQMSVLVRMIVQKGAQKYVLNKICVQPTVNVLPRMFVLHNVLVLLKKYLKNALSIVKLIALMSVFVRMIVQKGAQKYVPNKTCVQPTVNVLRNVLQPVLENVIHNTQIYVLTTVIQIAILIVSVLKNILTAHVTVTKSVLLYLTRVNYMIAQTLVAKSVLLKMDNVLICV